MAYKEGYPCKLEDFDVEVTGRHVKVIMKGFVPKKDDVLPSRKNIKKGDLGFLEQLPYEIIYHHILRFLHPRVLFGPINRVNHLFSKLVLKSFTHSRHLQEDIIFSEQARTVVNFVNEDVWRAQAEGEEIEKELEEHEEQRLILKSFYKNSNKISFSKYLKIEEKENLIPNIRTCDNIKDIIPIHIFRYLWDLGAIDTRSCGIRLIHYCITSVFHRFFSDSSIYLNYQKTVAGRIVINNLLFFILSNYPGGVIDRRCEDLQQSIFSRVMKLYSEREKTIDGIDYGEEFRRSWFRLVNHFWSNHRNFRTPTFEESRIYTDPKNLDHFLRPRTGWGMERIQQFFAFSPFVNVDQSIFDEYVTKAKPIILKLFLDVYYQSMMQRDLENEESEQQKQRNDNNIQKFDVCPKYRSLVPYEWEFKFTNILKSSILRKRKFKKRMNTIFLTTTILDRLLSSKKPKRDDLPLILVLLIPFITKFGIFEKKKECDDEEEETEGEEQEQETEYEHKHMIRIPEDVKMKYYERIMETLHSKFEEWKENNETDVRDNDRVVDDYYDYEYGWYQIQNNYFGELRWDRFGSEDWKHDSRRKTIKHKKLATPHGGKRELIKKKKSIKKRKKKKKRGKKKY